MQGGGTRRISFLEGFGSLCLLQRPWSPPREVLAQPAPGPICSSLDVGEAGCEGSLIHAAQPCGPVDWS